MQPCLRSLHSRLRKQDPRDELIQHQIHPTSAGPDPLMDLPAPASPEMDIRIYTYSTCKRKTHILSDRGLTSNSRVATETYRCSI